MCMHKWFKNLGRKTLMHLGDVDHQKATSKMRFFVVTLIFQDMLSGIPDGSLPDTLAAIVKASYLEKLEVSYQHTFI